MSEIDALDLVRQQKEASIPQPRRRTTDKDEVRFALYRAGRVGLTRIQLNDAAGPNSDRRYRELAKAGEAEKYYAGRTERGKALYRYRLVAATDLFGTHKEA